jgi:hypothetical protein
MNPIAVASQTSAATQSHESDEDWQVNQSFPNLEITRTQEYVRVRHLGGNDNVTGGNVLLVDSERAVMTVFSGDFYLWKESDAVQAGWIE